MPKSQTLRDARHERAAIWLMTRSSNNSGERSGRPEKKARRQHRGALQIVHHVRGNIAGARRHAPSPWAAAPRGSTATKSSSPGRRSCWKHAGDGRCGGNDDPSVNRGGDIVGMLFDLQAARRARPRSFPPQSSAPSSTPATIAAALEPSPTPRGMSFCRSRRTPGRAILVAAATRRIACTTDVGVERDLRAAGHGTRL